MNFRSLLWFLTSELSVWKVLALKHKNMFLNSEGWNAKSTLRPLSQSVQSEKVKGTVVKDPSQCLGRPCEPNSEMPQYCYHNSMIIIDSNRARHLVGCICIACADLFCVPLQEWFNVYENYRRTNCVASDLIMGNEYIFRVYAANMVGLSPEPCFSKDSAYIQKIGMFPAREPITRFITATHISQPNTHTTKSHSAQHLNGSMPVRLTTSQPSTFQTNKWSEQHL